MSEQFKVNSSPSLTEAKKARQHLEQEAKLLTNRVKLLQVEEERAQKRIQDAMKKTESIVKAQERRAREEEERERLRSERQRSTEEARRRFYSQRSTRDAEKLKRREMLWLSKKEAYAEGRLARDRATSSRRQFDLQSERFNQQRYKIVKSALRTGFSRVLQRKEEVARESRTQYQQRIEAEEKKHKEKQKEVEAMESLEMELINRLKLTQILEQQAIKQLEEVAKGRVTC